MKQKVLSVVMLVIAIAFVTVNTIVIDKQIKDIGDEVEAIDIKSNGALENARMIFEDFMNKEIYISLSVNHEDLTDIESCFVEMIGYLEVGDTENAIVTKERLRHSLEHLRRLSTFTIDAII